MKEDKSYIVKDVRHIILIWHGSLAATFGLEGQDVCLKGVKAN